MRRRLLYLLSFVALVLLASPLSLGQGHEVIVARVDGAIDPSVARYVLATIRQAEIQGAQLVVLVLDTPGGLDVSMRAIVQAMIRSPLPVAVLVGPAGARAASAGVFIAYAADVLAMAPSTNIGAAHPVALGGQMPEDEVEKATSDAAAYIRSLAQATGRNADWAAQAVRQSVSATAEEALQLHVIDLIATDVPDLLKKIDGRTVNKHGRSIILDTSEAPLQEVVMSLPEQLVHMLINPSVTYLLLAVAVWALIAEFSAPGISLPGVIGVVCLVLFAVSASIIPINWAGAGLIILSLIFFIMDLNAPTHGVLTIGGIATFVLGSLLLFRLPRSFQPAVMPQAQVWQAPVWLLVVVIGSTSAILLLALRMGVKAQKLAPVTGRGALLGAVGRVTSIQGDLATVQVRGELWSARPLENEPKLKKGDTVRVTNIEGLTLIVRKEDKE